MTSTPQPPPAPRPPLPVRELVGLALVVLGVAALSWIAFAFQPLLGGALVAALATGTGLWLCTSEERR